MTEEQKSGEPIVFPHFLHYTETKDVCVASAVYLTGDLPEKPRTRRFSLYEGGVLMKPCVLFSPIGRTDPLRNGADGPLLHILRHYPVRKAVLFLTHETYAVHRRDDRYVKLGRMVSPDTEFEVCGDEDLVNAHTFEILDAPFRAALERLNLLSLPFSPDLPLAPLHWLLADTTGALTLEPTAEGLQIYENPVGVLTNNPPFPQQLFALNNYMHLSPRQPENTFAPDVPLQAYSRGMGALGLPGDLSSGSRFVRAAFTKLHSVCGESEADCVGQFFHIMETVSQTRGCCEVAPGEFERTIYTSCWNAARGIYYYTTYGNRRITAVDLHREPLDGTALRRYPMLTAEDILMQNGGAGA